LIHADEQGLRAIHATLSEGTPQRGLTLSLRRGDGREMPVEAELWVSPSSEGRRTYLLAREPTGSATGGDPLHRLGEATACVAHQIKNSLHALQGLADEIAHDAVSAADRENLEHMLRVLKSLGGLSEDVLAIAGASRPPAESVPLSEVLTSATMLVRRTPGQVALELPGEELRVHAHRGQLVHALFNLLDNASRVTPPGEHVRIHARRDGESVIIEIADRGPGLPPGIANGAAPVASTSGAGFGVLAARRFVEDDGGRLCFEPAPGGGTISRVVFPAAESRA